MSQMATHVNVSQDTLMSFVIEVSMIFSSMFPLNVIMFLYEYVFLYCTILTV